MRLGLGLGLGGPLGGVGVLSAPDSRLSFMATAGLWIRRLGGIAQHNYTPDKFLPVINGSAVYLDSSTGSDGNNGSTHALARASITSAVNLVNSKPVGQVHTLLIAGNSLAPYRQIGNSITRSCVIQSYDGSRYATVGAVNTTPEIWSATSGQAGVYEASFVATPYSVVDLTFTETWGSSDEPAYRRLTLVASLVLCQSTPGSWFWSGGLLYVHTTDSRAPDQYVVPTNNSSQFGWVPGGTVTQPVLHIDRMDSIGGYNSMLISELAGSGGSGGNVNLRAYVNRSTAQICRDVAFQRFGLGNTFAFKVGCYESFDDGFQYNGLNTSSMTDPTGSHAEIECSAYNNGASPSTQSNNSSGHSMANIATWLPNHQNAWNRPIHDTYDSRRWLVDGLLGPSRQATGGTSRTLQAGNSVAQSTKIYVDGTILGPGSLYDLNTTSGCSILFKGGNPGYSVDPASAGTIGSY